MLGKVFKASFTNNYWEHGPAGVATLWEQEGHGNEATTYYSLLYMYSNWMFLFRPPLIKVITVSILLYATTILIL